MARRKKENSEAKPAELASGPLFTRTDSPNHPETETEAANDRYFEENAMFDDDMFGAAGTRIFIDGSIVTFENMTPELLDVAQSLNPTDKNLADRKALHAPRRVKTPKKSEDK